AAPATVKDHEGVAWDEKKVGRSRSTYHSEPYERCGSHGWVPPNGVRLSGARRAPPSDDDSPRTVCSGTAARLRCSPRLGARSTPTMERPFRNRRLLTRNQPRVA